MIKREVMDKILDVAAKMPVITITGPRQSGKTTLAKAAFSKHTYVTLEDPDIKEFALDDPRGFLEKYSPPVIFDEVQNVPQLLSYIQGIVDSRQKNADYILTGSRQLLLTRGVSQSLAGRSALFLLLPFSYKEVMIINPDIKIEELILHGGYPRIYDKNLIPGQWLKDYVKSYIERDVRDIITIGDLTTFQRFVRLCAARSGHLLNISNLAADAGISHTTVRRWISILEHTSVIFLLPPFHKNYSKRLIKAPKLYFFDTGLLCYLLRIREKDLLDISPMRGNIFETFIVSEYYKKYTNRGLDVPLFFWRDKTGHEIDIIIDELPVKAVEIKAGKTVSKDMMKNLKYWQGLAEPDNPEMVLCYFGDESYNRSGISVRSWKEL